MTGWLEYFVEGLATQMQEMVERGKGAIRSDTTNSFARGPTAGHCKEI